MQRRKGASGELEVRDLLRAVYPDCHRRSSGEESQEHRGRDLKNTPGLCVQSCVGARPNVFKKLLEAQRAAAGDMPVAFLRRDRGAWIVALPAHDFLALLVIARAAAEDFSIAARACVARTIGGGEILDSVELLLRGMATFSKLSRTRS